MIKELPCPNYIYTLPSAFISQVADSGRRGEEREDYEEQGYVEEEVHEIFQFDYGDNFLH